MVDGSSVVVGMRELAAAWLKYGSSCWLKSTVVARWRSGLVGSSL